MWLSVGSQWAGVLFMQPVIVLMVEFSWASNLLVWLLFSHMGAPYSAELYTSPSAALHNVEAEDPHVVPHNFWMMLFLVRILATVFCRWELYVRDLSRVIPRWFGFGLCFTGWPSNWMLSCRAASLLLRWKHMHSVLFGFGVSLPFSVICPQYGQIMRTISVSSMV